MRVTATAKGFYAGKVRDPGEVFGLTDARHFSSAWMTSDEPEIKAELERRDRLAAAKAETRDRNARDAAVHSAERATERAKQLTKQAKRGS